MPRTLPILVCLLTAAVSAAPVGPPQRLRAGRDVPEPTRLEHDSVDAADLAGQAGIDGAVFLDLDVSPEGRVTRARVLRSGARLDKTAIGRVKLWQYEPTVVDESPVAVTLAVCVAHFGSETSAAQHLSRALKDVNPLVRRLAAREIGSRQLRSKQAVGALTRALGDKDPLVRKAAAAALGEESSK